MIIKFRSVISIGSVQCTGFKGLAGAFCLAASLGIAIAQENPDRTSIPVVKFRQGLLRGKVLSDGGATFLGIPFGAAPLGNLRWQAPRPAAAWTGIRDAVRFGPDCAQARPGGNGELIGSTSEDCLYLNVWTPALKPKARLPVMLWVHGGGFIEGSGSNPVFNGEPIARHGVILVTINYRLGVFGFLAHPKLTRESPHKASGNYGLADQQAALRWVRKNIASFGGDPDRVTIFGQSAGAASVTSLMTSPLSRCLFQGVIAQSGTPMLGAGASDRASAETQGTGFATALGAATLADLRKLTTAQVWDGWKHYAADRSVRAGPIVDGWILPQPPALAFAEHAEMRVPLLIGNNARESLGDANGNPTAHLKSVFGDAATRAAAFYPTPEATPDPILGTTANMLPTDLSFRCPAVAVQWWHAQQGSPVYAYQFEASLPGREQAGAQHSSELMYVFGFRGMGNVGATPLSQTLTTYWTNFAEHGNPNGGSAPIWPRFEPQAAAFIYLGKAGVRVDARLRGPACDLYREVVLARALQRSFPR